MTGRALAIAGVLGWLAAQCGAAVDPGIATAPRTDFVVPQAGTYELQRIQRAGDGLLLDSAGRPTHIGAVTTGKITLLTFFYTYCMDPLGCPFAHSTLLNLRDQLLADGPIGSAVRFVNVSFDPTHDTPQALALYSEQFSSKRQFEWRFLTARSVRELLPVLDDFGQDVSVETDAHGTPSRARHHMLKVFLLDEKGFVREIYSVAFIQPQVILNDIRTLYLASGRIH
jgi:protein SCO1